MKEQECISGIFLIRDIFSPIFSGPSLSMVELRLLLLIFMMLSSSAQCTVCQNEHLHYDNH